jgi:hypothetical protein
MEVSGQLHNPAVLPPTEKAPDIHWIGSWLDTRAVLEAVLKIKIPSPRRESYSRSPIIYPVKVEVTDNKTKGWNYQLIILLKYIEFRITLLFQRRKIKQLLSLGIS